MDVEAAMQNELVGWRNALSDVWVTQLGRLRSRHGFLQYSEGGAELFRQVRIKLFAVGAVETVVFVFELDVCSSSIRWRAAPTSWT